jgi:hypothetical protein
VRFEAECAGFTYGLPNYDVNSSGYIESNGKVIIKYFGTVKQGSGGGLFLENIRIF